VTGASSHLAAVHISDYRNLARVALELPAAGLTLIGDNGQGKTNFLEAIYYFQLLRSSRGARDADTVRFGGEAFHLRGDIVAPRASVYAGPAACATARIAVSMHVKSVSGIRWTFP
jgi:recombinational DNA repair ATPase RecF